MAETKKKLPKSEWDFSKLTPEQVPYAFFYEYARQVSKVKELVYVYRSLHPYIDIEDVPDKNWRFSKEKINHLPRAVKIALLEKAASFKQNEYLALIRWLSYCNKFPATPFLELKSADYLNSSDVPANARVFPVNGHGLNDIGYCWRKDFLNKEAYNFEVRISLGLFQPVAPLDSDDDHVTFHRLRIDWWKTDSELQDEFSEWIRVYRKHLKVKPISAASRGLLNSPLDLPKECRKMGTALAHLGKLRCLEASGTWEKYLDVYHTEKSDRRYLEKDVSAARKVISWLEDKV